MDAFAALISRLVGALLSPFVYLPDAAGVALFAVLSGVGILYLFGKLTNQPRLERARDLMAAAVYEVRIFFDSPLRIVSAQFALVVASLKYTLQTIPSLVVISIPIALLFGHLEARFGLAPLTPRSTIVVHATLREGVDPNVKVIEENGIALTAPPVFMKPTRDLYLRVTAPTETHDLKLEVAGKVVTKELSVTPGARFVNPERASGLSALIAVGTEPPLDASTGLEKISVQHATRSMKMLVSAPWWVHWLVLSSIAALAAKKRLGVTI